MTTEHKGDWYPSEHQLKTPKETERSIRRILDLFYEHRNVVTARLDAKPAAGGAPAGPAPGGPASTFVGGIPVEPFDVNTLNDGDSLKYDKARRRFVIKT